MRSPCLKFLLFVFLTAIARADDQWILTTADFRSDAIALRSIDPSGVHVSIGGG